MATLTARQASHAYRREARRLRGRLSRQPVELYRSLRDLSDRHDRIYAELAEQAPIEQSPTSAFADQVFESLEDGILPFSRRLALLGAAEEFGIGRFQANLIIAAVQHQHGAADGDEPRQRQLCLLPILVFLLVQSLILAGIWAVVLR